MSLCSCGCGQDGPGPARRGHHKRVIYPDPVRDQKSGCLLWQGPISPEGYPRLGKTYVHRKVYEECVGPIPAGYQVDHVAERGCCYRHCIEPTHLEAVTQADNIRRQSNMVRQIQATHCPQGHPYVGENLRLRIVNERVKRGCRQCDRDSAKKGM